MEIRETSRYGALTSSLCITFTQLQSGQLIVHPEWRGRKIILAKKLKMSQRHKKKKKFIVTLILSPTRTIIYDHALPLNEQYIN